MSHELGFDEYQRLADLTFDRSLSTGQGALMAALGLAGETGEVIEIIKKWQYHNKSFEISRLEEELGDVLWYLACMASRFGISMQSMAYNNILKLQMRYIDRLQLKPVESAYRREEDKYE